MARQYEKTHPWLTFQLDMRSLGPGVWIKMGEVVRGSIDIKSIPVSAGPAEAMAGRCRAEGIFGTLALDGSMLELEEVRRLLGAGVEGGDDEVEGAGASRHDRREIDALNVDRTCIDIVRRLEREGGSWDLSAEDMAEINGSLTVSSPDANGNAGGRQASRGRLRSGEGVDIAYRGVPAQDCDYLLERLGTGLAEIRRGFPAGDETVSGIVRGILAHAYLSWILPFETANGRTARMAEYQMMVAGGIPEPVVFQLGSYYNRTSRDYLALLGRHGNVEGDILPFIEYVVEGLVEAVGDQIRDITSWQEDIVWEDHVSRVMSGLDTRIAGRQRILVIDLARVGGPVPIGKVRSVSSRVTALYAGASDKTVARDIKCLERSGLLEREGRKLSAVKRVLRPGMRPRAGWQGGSG